MPTTTTSGDEVSRPPSVVSLKQLRDWVATLPNNEANKLIMADPCGCLLYNYLAANFPPEEGLKYWVEMEGYAILIAEEDSRWSYSAVWKVAKLPPPLDSLIEEFLRRINIHNHDLRPSEALAVIEALMEEPTNVEKARSLLSLPRV